MGNKTNYFSMRYLITLVFSLLVCSLSAQLAPVKGVDFKRDYLADTLVGVSVRNTNSLGVAGYKMIMGNDTAYIALWNDSLVIWSDGEIFMQPEMSISNIIQATMGENVTSALMDGAAWLYGQNLSGNYTAMAMGDLTNLGVTDHAFTVNNMDTAGTTEQTVFIVRKANINAIYQVNASLPKVLMTVDTTGAELSYRRSTDSVFVQADQGKAVMEYRNLPTNLMTLQVDANTSVTSTTGAFILPRMTTTQRDALTPVNGMMIYNTTLFRIEGRENGVWVNL